MNPVVRELEEQSTWRLLGLTIITYGVYAAFYARRQTLKFNQHLPLGDRIPPLLPNVVIGLNLLSLALLVPYFLVKDGHVMETVSDLVDVAATISFIFWGFAARGRMNRLLSAERDQTHWFHALWTFLLSPLYFNYKINVLVREPPAPLPAV